jgi:cyclopropane fatty-acyl-phospholipid synthase-like methyltransferase
MDLKKNINSGDADKSSCNQNTNKQSDNIKSHWETVYQKNSHQKLGWYEEHPTPSLDLIDKCKLNKNAVILNVGAGATTLIDELLALNYNQLIATDISSKALDVLKNRLPDDSPVKCIVDDLTQPSILNELPQVDLWHDRAVLHFFTSQNDQDTYFKLLKSKVKSGGYVILATFNLQGATKCSGLPVKQYNAEMLQEKLGNDFEMIESFDYLYTMPSGDTRAYVYTLFKRQ